MDLTAKDWLVIVSPLVALIIAVITTIFNIIDRRKKYEIEKEKILAELKSVLLNNVDFLQNKYRINNELMAKISKMTALVQIVYDSVLQEDWRVLDDFSSLFQYNECNQTLNELINILRENQIYLTNEIHIWFTREYARKQKVSLVELNNMAEKIDKTNIGQARYLLNEIIGNNDRGKTRLRDDLSATLSGMLSTGDL